MSRQLSRPGFEWLVATLGHLPGPYADGDGPAVGYRCAMGLEVALFDAACEE